MERLDLYGPWFSSINGGRCCKVCNKPYLEDESADEYGTGLCYHCFEDGVEAADERRRLRIARQNEY